MLPPGPIQFKNLSEPRLNLLTPPAQEIAVKPEEIQKERAYDQEYQKRKAGEWKQKKIDDRCQVHPWLKFSNVVCCMIAHEGESEQIQYAEHVLEVEKKIRRVKIQLNKSLCSVVSVHGHKF